MALALDETRDNFISRQRKSVRSYALKTGRYRVAADVLMRCIKLK